MRISDWSSDVCSSDLPADPLHYNRLVRLPFAASHERMWRDDGLYDLVVEIGYNDMPPVPGLGSAIFLHLARPDWGPRSEERRGGKGWGSTGKSRGSPVH